MQILNNYERYGQRYGRETGKRYKENCAAEASFAEETLCTKAKQNSQNLRQPDSDCIYGCYDCSDSERL